MTLLLYPFIFLSAVGLILSFVVHLSALLNYDLGLGQAVWGLHIGIFVVWIPAVLVTMSMTKDFKQRDLWNAALRGCPGWMRKAAYGFFIYAVGNFVLFSWLMFKKPPEHSALPPPLVLRGFSGHWMAFYAMALATLYSATRVKAVDASRRCQNGHPVPPLAKYCEECGAQVL